MHTVRICPGTPSISEIPTESEPSSIECSYPYYDNNKSPGAGSKWHQRSQPEELIILLSIPRQIWMKHNVCRVPPIDNVFT